MASVNSVEAWEHSKNDLTSSSWTASDWETKVFSMLKFSYDQLTDETHRKCFLYCALCPEDHQIPVHHLIYQWIGEGFLYNEMMTSVHDMCCHGGSVIEKLKHSCLLEKVERSIKMHDVIRDMTPWIARDQDKNKRKVIVQEDAWPMSQANVEDRGKVETISISIMNDAKSYIQSIVWTNLTTLILNFGDAYKINGLHNIQYAKRLKVLELGVQRRSRIQTVARIPVEIVGLNCLEYLSLDRLFFPGSEISRELMKLKNLKVFILHIPGGDVVPLGLIRNLQQLKVFRFLDIAADTNVDGRDEKEFVEGLERSSILEELWMGIRTGSGLNQLCKSAKLPSCMHSLIVSNVYAQINGPLLLATLSKMKLLQRLEFLDLNNVIDPSAFDTLLELLDFPNLRSICKRFLSFPSLRSVEVLRCPNLKKLPFDSSSAKAKLRLIKGSQVWWNNLEWDDTAVEVTFQSKFQAYTY
ncbi:disease resistance protein RPS5-like [Neltuma alba]|uniref:disease resistance protein RPS5-like n=1 Tax=Neltuma alba TaxID=207710 RepID=UPI0010A32765|nr:disease resistance protein RPS5-like [Prosopis alba]